MDCTAIPSASKSSLLPLLLYCTRVVANHSEPLRVDYDACEKGHLDWWINGDPIHVGPGFLEGPTHKVEGCQMRYIKCKESGDYEWTQEEDPGLSLSIQRGCEELDGGGGVRRMGDLCLVYENPDRPIVTGKPKKRATPKAVRAHPKDLPVSRSTSATALDKLQRRQSCSGGGSCYGYTQTTFAGNVRGIKELVCDSLLNDGDTCAETKSVTITDTYTAGVDVSAGLKEVIDVTASFSKANSEAVQTQLATTIKVDCPGGKGRVVWYPYMEVSRGECTKGDCSDGVCWTEERFSCETRKPVPEDSGLLKGEYDVECI